MLMNDASDGEIERLIQRLNLRPHPEGGYFRETYRHPQAFGGRALATAIYFLVTAVSPSRMHRVASDEMWHFYCGDPLEMLQLAADGASSLCRIGIDVEHGEAPQVLVPAGAWQGTRVAPGGRFALIGATVVPGFDFADFTMGERAALTRAYPDRESLIAALT